MDKEPVSNVSNINKPPERAKLDRKDFNELAAKGLISTGVILAVASEYVNDLNITPEDGPKFRNKQIVNTPSGKIKIITGMHGSDKIPIRLETSIEQSDFTQPNGGIFVENSEKVQADRPNSPYTRKKNFRNLVTRLTEYALEGDYSDLNPFLRGAVLEATKGVPLYFGDLIEKPGPEENKIIFRNKQIAYLLASGAISFSAAQLMLKQKLPPERKYEKKLTRRVFLKKIAQAVLDKDEFIKNTYRLMRITTALSAGTAMILSSESILNIAHRLGISPIDERYKDIEAILTDLIEPQDYVVNMRNIVWALKMGDLQERGFIKKTEVLHLLAGDKHKHIRFFIKNPDIAKDLFKLFGYNTLVKDLSGDYQDWVWKTFRYKVGKPNEIVVHENLKKLME